MKFYENLYMCEKVKKKKKQVIKKIEQGILVIDLFVLALPSSKANQLEIYSSAMLLQPVFLRQQPYIIGLAYSYEEALILVKDIVLESYQVTGSYDVRKYLLEEEKKIRK